MPSLIVDGWNGKTISSNPSLCSWSAPAGCTADSLTVSYDSGTSTYLYWRDGNWRLRSGHTSTYSVSGTSGSETFFAGGSGQCVVTVTLSYHNVETASTITAVSPIALSSDASTHSATSTVTISNSTMNISGQHLIHKLVWSGGGWTSNEVETAAGATNATCDIYPSCSYFPTYTAYTLTITCRTFSGNTQIGGTTRTTVVVTVPPISPSISLSTLAINTNTKQLGRCLPGVTSVHLAGIVTPAHGATTTSITIAGGGVTQSVTASELLDGIDVTPTQAGDMSFTINATDSRGFPGQRQPEATEHFTYTAYYQPSLSASSYRCTSNGTRQGNGTYVAVQTSASYTLFTDTITQDTPQNSIRMTFEYSDDNVSFQPLSSSDCTLIDNVYVLGNNTPIFATDHQYYVRAILTDDIGSVARSTLFIGTAEVFMRWDKTHNAFGFGAYPSDDNSVYLNPTWKLFTHGNEIIDLLHPVGSVYMSINNVEPSTIFPGTVWSPINQDQYLMSAGATVAGGTAGGSATHTHTTSGHTLTAAELPQHYHGYLDWWNTSYDSGQTDTRAAVAVNGDNTGGANMNNRSRTNGVIMSTTDMSVRTGNNINQPHDHGDTGAASNKPPYYAVYMWVRTA